MTPQGCPAAPGFLADQGLPRTFWPHWAHGTGHSTVCASSSGVALDALRSLTTGVTLDALRSLYTLRARVTYRTLRTRRTRIARVSLGTLCTRGSLYTLLTR